MKPEREATDVIVIGGGISGLAAARDLALARKRVVLIEARGRLGGRIFTARPAGWEGPVELGAQFVHAGNADLWNLLRSSRTQVARVPDLHWRSRLGDLTRIRNLDEEIASVTRLIDEHKAGNLSFGEYFERHPPAVGADAWMLAKGFVEGFEAAPLRGISARSLAGEAMDDEKQFIVPHGYDRVVAFLASECHRLGVRILQGTPVNSVGWKQANVQVRAVDESTRMQCVHVARAAIISLPLGVLMTRRGKGTVSFRPPLASKRAVVARMGVGRVVRMAFRFSKKHWMRMLPDILRRSRASGFGFMHSSAQDVPVWWSLTAQPVLVGWAGGPRADYLSKLSAGRRRRRALTSLAKILGIRPHIVMEGAADMVEWGWNSDPYSRGAYSFTAAGQDSAAKKLAKPLAGTLFFAGEATAEGSEVGTVHGALSSGRRAAGEALDALAKRR